MVGIAMPPKADDPGLDPNFLGDRPRAASGRRQKNYPRPLQIALQRHRRATARLKHLAIFPRKVDFSRFGYHPYLESRLTIQEKWVLVRLAGPSKDLAEVGNVLRVYPVCLVHARRLGFLTVSLFVGVGHAPTVR